jgi:outer membrane murein-binding lipoprotein Lpp
MSWWARFALPTLQFSGACIMSNESSLSSAELNSRIRILEDNIRQLIEQAAAASGERNEARIADRLSQQNEELERLTRERDARSKK